MSLWLINTLLACLVSAVFTSVLIPKILLVSFRRRLFDPVDSRKIHQGIIPRLGGIAFMPSIFFTILLLVGINTAFAQGELWRNIQDNITEISFTCCALLLLYLTGIIDDMIGVRYKNKFVIQILCGILLISAGLALHDLYGVFGIQVLYKNETIWTTQKAMAELFDVDRTVITKHLKNIFESSELQINSVCAKFAHTADDGKTYNTAFYNLDAIIWPSGTYR